MGRELIIVIITRQTENTPAGNPAHWITVVGLTAEYGSAGRAAGAAARKIAKKISPATRAHRITSGCSWNYPSKGEFEERVLYAFHNGEIN